MIYILYGRRVMLRFLCVFCLLYVYMLCHQDGVHHVPASSVLLFRSDPDSECL